MVGLLKVFAPFTPYLVGLILVSATAQVAAQQAPVAEADHLTLALERSLCLQCHQAPKSSASWVRPLVAPPLLDLEERITPAWMEAWILDPQSQRPGTRMPNMLNGFAQQERLQAAADLSAFLLTSTDPVPMEMMEVGPEMLASGEALFTEIGCIACHENGFADRQLASMTSVPALRDQLLKPHQVRPSGLMPDMHLSNDEATDLAAWLLRQQVEGGEGQLQLLAGWNWQAFEYDGSATTGPDWQSAERFNAGISLQVDESVVGEKDRFGLLFDGVLQVPEDGDYSFYVASDDGSTLSIDGELLIDARFHQSHTRREANHNLSAGSHTIQISYYEAGGDESLEVGWAGPGFEERTFAGDDVQHQGQVFVPLGYSAEPQSGNAERGAQLFGDLRCDACHTSTLNDQLAEPAATPFQALNPNQGCLGEHPDASAPAFNLASNARGALNNAIANTETLSKAPSNRVRAATSLKAMACTACHPRDGVGAPTEAQLRRFVSVADLGEEGRVPPTLNEVEAKLKPQWLRKVVTTGAKVRPYMKTRMPAFSAPSGQAVAQDLLANRAPMMARPQPQFDVEQVQMGRELAGTKGLACIVCHNLAGHKSPGIPGLDLATVSERLEPQWFQQWLRNPHDKRSDTRMPAFWNEQGKSALTRIGEGRADLQIHALWAYLSLGAAMPLPEGLITNPARYALIPMDRPIYFGTFMEGLSARVLTVGFPERVHLAFDQHHVRLAKVWRGDFMNAKGTWDGRAGQLESPAGVEVLDLPPGPAFAQLADGEAWPQQGGKDGGTGRMTGHRRDLQGNPTFRYHYGALQVEETLIPKLGVDGAYFQRSFRLFSPDPMPGLQRRWLDHQGELQQLAVSLSKGEGGYYATIEEILEW